MDRCVDGGIVSPYGEKGKGRGEDGKKGVCGRAQGSSVGGRDVDRYEEDFGIGHILSPRQARGGGGGGVGGEGVTTRSGRNGHRDSEVLKGKSKTFQGPEAW